MNRGYEGLGRTLLPKLPPRGICTTTLFFHFGNYCLTTFFKSTRLKQVKTKIAY